MSKFNKLYNQIITEITLNSFNDLDSSNFPDIKYIKYNNFPENIEKINITSNIDIETINPDYTILSIYLLQHCIKNKKDNGEIHGINYCDLSSQQFYIAIHDGLKLLLNDIETNPIFLQNKNNYLNNDKIIDSIILFKNSQNNKLFLLALNLNILNPDAIEIELKTIYQIDNFNIPSLTNGFHLKKTNFLLKFYEYVPLFNKPIICESSIINIINIFIKYNYKN